MLTDIDTRAWHERGAQILPSKQINSLYLLSDRKSLLEDNKIYKEGKKLIYIKTQTLRQLHLNIFTYLVYNFLDFFFTPTYKHWTEWSRKDLLW